MSFAALGLFIGLILIHNGRKIRLERDLGGWNLGFIDVETGLDYLVFNDVCDVPINITIDWIFAEKEAGRLLDPTENADTDGRRRKFLGLDRTECSRRDRKSARRFRWSWAALNGGPATTSDKTIAAWIATRTDLINDDAGMPEPLPRASTLRCWVRKLKAARGRRGALVSCAGRLPGQSPLPALEDWLIQEAVLYHSTSEAAKIIDAAGYYIEIRDRIASGSDAKLKEGLSDQPVRLETIRSRIRSHEGHATTETRDGSRRARRMFEMAGRGVPTERFLERVEIDGLELRQIVLFSEDWPVPAGKMRLVNAIDAHTGFWFWPSMFCGPYREDMTAIAMMNVMMPPKHLSPDHEQEFPWLKEAFGTPDTVIPDNEKALFSPGAVSALTELGPDFELPKVNHPDGKPMVEALNRFIKGFLEGRPGTVLGPRHPKDPTRNAVKEAELTRAQLRTLMMHAWIEWNTTKRDRLGRMSPLDLVAACIQSGDWPKRNTPGEIKRGFFKTYDGICITRDGFEHDGIKYQALELSAVVDANYRNTGFKNRVAGTAKILASVRINEGNLHEALVFDQERLRYVPAYSTEPSYTLFLSRWEHNEFKQMMEARSPRRLNELEKMRRRGVTLKEIAVQLPKLNVRASTKAAGLLEREEFRRAAGARAHTMDEGSAAFYGLLAISGADIRSDVPRPVRVPAPPHHRKLPGPPAELLRALAGESPSDSTDAQTAQSSETAEPETFIWPDLEDLEDDDSFECGDRDDEENDE